jgi:hypothetical protein
MLPFLLLLLVAWAPAAKRAAMPAHPESGERPICDDPRCGTSITQGACEACALFRQELTPEHLEQVAFSGRLIEHGVALRAVSPLPDVQDRLFAVAIARNEILQQVHEGADVALCEPCSTNARSFIDVQFAVERIPEGVILSYTSNRDDLVAWLQVMLMNTPELPL